MAKIRFKYKVLISFIGLYQTAYGALPSDSSDTHTAQQIKIDRIAGQTNNSQCGELLSLEVKEDLTNSEIEVGTLIHEILQQITDSPLEYCAELAMEPVDELKPTKPEQRF